MAAITKAQRGLIVSVETLLSREEKFLGALSTHFMLSECSEMLLHHPVKTFRVLEIGRLSIVLSYSLCVKRDVLDKKPPCTHGALLDQTSRLRNASTLVTDGPSNNAGCLQNL